MAGPAYVENPFYRALTSTHASFAVTNGPAVRYAPDVIPFAAVSEPTPEAMLAFRDLFAPNESLFTTGPDFPEVPGLLHTLALPGLQMRYEGPLPAPEPEGSPEHGGDPEVLRLGAGDVEDMLALKAVAFPGYFGPEASRLGSFFGIRVNGQLVAMAGERLCTPTVREISAVCTHPEHTGRGYAALLVRAVIRAQAACGAQSLLHVVASNQRAIDLYHRLGFTTTGDILFHRFKRV